jgi:hypothetical protein
MATSTETSINTADLASPLLGGVLNADVIITAPPNNAKLGPSFTITGTASCWARETTGAEFDATSSITAVDIRLGGDTNPFQSATPTGSGSTPWASWTFAANTTLRGSVAITARVSATRSGFGSNIDTAVRQVTIDITPPTFTVNPPADVTKATPPYTATITGTATDDATGVAAVEWRLGNSGSFQAATGTTAWSATMALPGLGAHAVTIPGVTQSV